MSWLRYVLSSTLYGIAYTFGTKLVESTDKEGRKLPTVVHLAWCAAVLVLMLTLIDAGGPE